MKQLRYKIYTENKDLARILTLVKEWLPCATVYQTLGVWNGLEEPGIVIEYLGSISDWHHIELLARLLKDSFNQEAILLTTESVEVTTL